MGIDDIEPYVVCPFTVIVDTREQKPWHFLGFNADANQENRPLIVPTERNALKTGDYSIKGMEDLITIERKSHSDAWSTFIRERDRFERELERMSKMEFAAIIIECDENSLLCRRPIESRANPKTIYRSLIAWEQRFGVHVRFCETVGWAERTCFRYLERFWKDKESRKSHG